MAAIVSTEEMAHKTIPKRERLWGLNVTLSRLSPITFDTFYVTFSNCIIIFLFQGLVMDSRLPIVVVIATDA